MPATLNPPTRTIWGLDALQLHTRYWAARGVQVVRQGEPSQIVPHAELYLLTDPRLLTIFSLAELVDTLNWIEPTVLFVRLRDRRDRSYRERALTDPEDRFLKFERIYDSGDRLARVVLTPDREVAELWQGAADPLSAWRRLRRFTMRIDRTTLKVNGRVYDRTDDHDVAFFLRDLVKEWKRPDATIGKITRSSTQDLWSDPSAVVEPEARTIGPVWVGAGRRLTPGTTVIGPAVVWDDPAARPMTEAIEWAHIEPSIPPQDQTVSTDRTFFYRAAKRIFDLAFASAGLLGSLWMYPFIMAIIWWEDGRPFFFGHERETRGGRVFKCWKFRSMRRDAEKMKEQLKMQNQADGPQFYMENDPRLTRIGRFLRRYNLDELPQFWNVFVGDMSVVGPRPSPKKENQFCPGWREARLSVRPGVTGLWQIRRTRRAGADFQEWIKYDLQYVENASFALDVKIIYQTAMQIVRKGARQ